MKKPDYSKIGRRLDGFRPRAREPALINLATISFRDRVKYVRDMSYPLIRAFEFLAPRGEQRLWFWPWTKPRQAVDPSYLGGKEAPDLPFDDEVSALWIESKKALHRFLCNPDPHGYTMLLEFIRTRCNLTDEAAREKLRGLRLVLARMVV